MRRYFGVIFLVLLCAGSLPAQGWKAVATTIFGSRIRTAAFLNETYGFAGTNQRFCRTTDGGATWTSIPGLLWNNASLQFYFNTPANIFLAGFLESTDSGMTWQPLPSAAPSGYIYIKDGVIYDASGVKSMDHGKSWVRFTPFQTGETITGNLGDNIAIWGGSFGAKTSATNYSTDGGNSWQPGLFGVESDFGYAIPFTSIFFRAGGDGTDAIQRSPDGGATWQTQFGFVPTRYFSDAIAGDACIVYAQTQYSTSKLPWGVYRSIDQGITWNFIGGPTGVDDAAFCGVTTRGSVCYGMGYVYGPALDTLFKFSDPTVYTPLLHDVKLARYFPDTLTTIECDSINLALEVGFSACDFMRLQDIWIEGIAPNNYHARFTKDKIIRTGVSDLVNVEIYPPAPGTYHLRVHLHVAASDWSGSDTTIPFVLVVKPNHPKLMVERNDTINFGTSIFCNAGGRDTIRLSNPGCYAVDVTSIRFESDSATMTDFSILQPSPISLHRDDPAPVQFVISFHPNSPGVKKGHIIIVSNIRNDTIAVIGEVLPDQLALLTSSDTLNAPICEKTDGTLRFTNNSCRSISLDAVTIPMPFTLVSGQLPILILPSLSASIHLQFNPSLRGMQSVKALASLRFMMPNDTITFDTSVMLSGEGTHGTSDYALSSGAILFDTLHLCESASRNVVLKSIGCDSLPLGAISISGDADFSYTVLGAQPTELASGDSLSIKITAFPQKIGTRKASLTLRFQGGEKVDIPIKLEAIRALRVLVCDKKGTLDFGKHLVCDDRDTIIMLLNPGCDTVKVFGCSLSATGFDVDQSIFPITLAPAKNISVRVLTTLDTAGTIEFNSSELIFSTNADNLLEPIKLKRSYIYPHPVHLFLSADPKPLGTKDTFKVYLKGIPNELGDIHSIDFHADFDSNLLGNLKFIGPNISSCPDGKNFSFSGSQHISIGKDSIIAEMDFYVYLAKATTTSFVPDHIIFNSSDPTFTGCVAIPFSNGVNFGFKDSCGDPSLRSFMRGGPFTFQIRPNPASGDIGLHITTLVSEPATFELFDALGVKIMSEEKNLLPGENSLNMSTASLSQGVYLTRVRTSRGISAEQSFVKLK